MKSINNYIHIWIWLGFTLLMLGILLIGDKIPNSQINLQLDNDWISSNHNKLSWSIENKYSIYYTGFIGCSQRCPLALYELNKLCQINSNVRGIFLIIDPLLEWKDIQSFISNFPNIQVYKSISSNPHNQLRNLKFFMGIQNPNEHSDHFLVIPPKDKMDKPYLTKNIQSISQLQ